MGSLKGKAFMAGASASLNYSMEDIDAILDGVGLRVAGPLREKLRVKLRKALVKIAKDWLKHGFKGGHIVTANEYQRTGVFPIRIARSISREFPVKGKGKAKQIDVISTLPKNLQKEIKTRNGASRQKR